MGLSGFERRLERILDGAMGRLANGGVKPVELGHRIVREMDLRRTIDVNGRTLVPNEFSIRLNPGDCDALEEIANAVCRDLAGTASHHAASEGYFFVGPPKVVIIADPSVRSGVVEIESHFDDGPMPSGQVPVLQTPAPSADAVEQSSPAAASATPVAGQEPALTAAEHLLVLPDGQQVPLGPWLISVGRDPSSTIVLQDPNASRHHAEIRPIGVGGTDGFDIIDLQSTNGVQVNGGNVAQQRLRDGDVLTFGTTSMRFVSTSAR